MLHERLLEALALKELPRAGWVREGVAQPESVAAHSWGVAWLVLVLCPKHIDREQALCIAIVHDLAEVRVGDITPHDGVAADDKAARELAAFSALNKGLPVDLMPFAHAYGNTPEGRFVKACDKLDMALQAQRYGSEQGLDLQEFIDSALAKLEPGLLRELAAGD
jgi:putative hydrolase of HD superfamily